MFDKFLAIGASFDWITPTSRLIQNAINGPSHTFLIPIHQSPMTGREICRMLKRRGVDTWAPMIVSGTLMVNVRKMQAQQAQYLLSEAGVPTTTEYQEPEQAQQEPGGGWISDLLGE